jgi:glycosyltransferase involved in cell wall biosynthesis
METAIPAEPAEGQAKRSLPPPIVSVVIPHLNQPDHLARCLASLQKQTFGLVGVEIIVVDNGSKVVPTEICTRFPDVMLVQELTPGPGPARNKAVTISSAHLLAFIDADCIADPEWLRAAVSTLQRLGPRSVIGGDVRIAVNDARNPTDLESYESVFAYRQREYIEQQGFSGTGNLAMNRAVYEAVGPFGGIDIAEDRDWGQRAAKIGYVTKYVPEMMVYHPARRSIDELFQKLERHVSHDFAIFAGRRFGRLKWFARALAVFVSPIFETLRIARSRRISGLRARWRAGAVVFRLRAYRAKQMIMLLLNPTRPTMSTSWNR